MNPQRRRRDPNPCVALALVAASAAIVGALLSWLLDRHVPVAVIVVCAVALGAVLIAVVLEGDE